MDSSPPCGPWKPCLHHHHHHHLFLCPIPLPHHHHHHHHHLHISPQCPHHSYLLQPNSHSLASPNFLPLPNQSNLQVSGFRQTYPPLDALMMQEEGYEEGVVEEDEDEDEDEEDPVFVLTDEWKEFFAKSEAKRKLAKKQARKKGKV